MVPGPFCRGRQANEGDPGISGAVSGWFRGVPGREVGPDAAFRQLFSLGNRNFSSCGLPAEYFFVPLRTRNMRETDYNKLN